MPDPPYESLLTSVEPAESASVEAGLEFQPRSDRDPRDVAPLLKNRLRMFCILGAVAFALGILRTVIAEWADASSFNWTTIGWFFVRSVASAIVLGVVARLLYSSRRWSMFALRGMESVLVLALTAFGVGETCWVASEYLVPLATSPNRADTFAFFVANSISVIWITVIIGYGLFIPNTTRRCLLVVSLIATAPLATGVAFAPFLERGVLVNLLSIVFMWMAIAVMLAVYGVRRIEVLNEKVREARRLGPYRLKRLIGAGGMGQVHLAEHTLLRRPCAVKLIRPDRSGDFDAIRRFEREVQATATLTNWHTVEIYDYGRSADGTFYYVMEYLEGLNLQQLVTRFGPLPAARVTYLLNQVCEALAEAHAVGLIHRDIKPSNIIVSHRGGQRDVAKLVDFGLVLDNGSQGSANLTGIGAVAGTPAYLSPEQAADSHRLDHRSDIYSLAAVGHFLLCGDPPFVRKTATETVAAHIYEPPPRIPVQRGVPADLESLLTTCLQKFAGDRIQTIEEFGRALRGCDCSGDWGPADAAAWWQTHGET